MHKDFVIAIGGTGARCLEALIYLAAAGLFTRPLQVLIIDPDQNNGNSLRTKKILPLYHELHGCEQPIGIKQRALITKGQKLSEPTLFQAAINADNHAANSQYPFFWQDPNQNDRLFSEAIDYPSLSTDFQTFLKLFYEEKDLSMKMGKGYRGRPNVGAVTLATDLKRTVTRRGNGLFEILDSIRADIKSNTVRVFVFGSVFGGTGAAGLPTIPELLHEQFEERGGSAKLRFGCAMMTPYFSFEKGQDADGPTPDSDLHQVATQAALLHYSNVPPSYQHAYVIGAPDLRDSVAGHHAGGEYQENESHYAEIIAALAARDFFSLKEINPNDHQLHYADAPEISWSSLPISANVENGAREIKHKLVAFTTLAYLYKNILYVDLKDHRWRSKQAWYKDNFTKRELALENHGQTLDQLNTFATSYLSWLKMVGESAAEKNNPLFNWGALSQDGRDAERELGRLTVQESEESPRYVSQAFGRIMEKLNHYYPNYENKVHPVGLLMYLLNQATLQFSIENYYMK